MLRRSFLTSALPFSLLAQGGAPSGKARGVPMAAITIEVFSDFQCPACRVLHQQTLKPMIRDYVDKGKVYLRHRDFPLPMHAYARQAAGLACAAARIGRYEIVADTLFDNQAAWVQDGQIEKTLAKVLTADELKKVRALATSPEVQAEIDADTKLAQSSKVNETPTLVVLSGSQRFPLAGAVNYSLLRRLLDQLAGR